MRACTMDLETTGFDASFMGVILCACIKPFDGEVTVFRRDEFPHWDKRSDDSAICKAIDKELQKYDIWVAHNGVNFDINFLRARLHRWGLRLSQPKNVDPVKIARRYLRIRSKDLNSLSRHLGIKQHKTDIIQDVWNRAALDGSKKDMNYIVDHCIRDVKVLEQVADKIKYLVPRINLFGSEM